MEHNITSQNATETITIDSCNFQKDYLLTPQITPPVDTCSVDNCDGCCDVNGNCVTGDSTQACGTGGVTCVACTGGTCENGISLLYPLVLRLARLFPIAPSFSVPALKCLPA